ncbi:MAG: hypothetical protein DRI86_03870 [Bacteroidetes bacterium]|nr:MAG: hypothetical protein DRI86_03870 [Bacteroidota bacterium]
MLFKFSNKDELKALIRILQEISMELESLVHTETDIFRKYEVSARVELIDEILPKLMKKQFSKQVKSSIEISKAVSIIIFQYREIAVDIYAEVLKNRLVETIYREMV